MWRPSPMSIYRFHEDIEYIVGGPVVEEDGRLSHTRYYPQIAGYTEVVNPDLDPWHGLREALGTLSRNLQTELVDRGRVADRDRWRLRIDVGPDGIVVIAKVETWPAIPGLTVGDQS